MGVLEYFRSLTVTPLSVLAYTSNSVAGGGFGTCVLWPIAAVGFNAPEPMQFHCMAEQILSGLWFYNMQIREKQLPVLK